MKVKRMKFNDLDLLFFFSSTFLLLLLLLFLVSSSVQLPLLPSFPAMLSPKKKK